MSYLDIIHVFIGICIGMLAGVVGSVLVIVKGDSLWK